MTVPNPVNETRLIPGKAGRGRPSGIKPIWFVMHIQQGDNDLPTYFINTEGDSTIWNKKHDPQTKQPDFELVSMLLDSDTPYTNGDWQEPDLSNPLIKTVYNSFTSPGQRHNPNWYSLTIEHQGFTGKPFPREQLENTARMIAYWSDKHNIPINRNTVIGHYQIQKYERAYCPGNTFDFDFVIKRANEIKAQYSRQTSKVFNIPGVGSITVNDPFLKFWEDNGDVQIFGLPLTPEKVASDFGLTFKGTAQYFERSRFEYQDESGLVMLGRLGAEKVGK